MYDVSYMIPSRGKWKWSHTDQGPVDKEAVLMHVATPHAVGSGVLLATGITMRETPLLQSNLTMFDHLTPR